MNVRFVLASLCLVSSLAHAQPDQADAEFQRGKQLMTQGKFADACAAFDKSQALEANVSVLLNQGNCREKNGQLATARDLFLRAAMQTDRASDARAIQLHNVAVDRAAKLADRVSSLTIEVPDAARVAGLMVKRNGAVVAPELWNNPVLLDGGTYVVAAGAPDRAPWLVTITVGNEHDRKTVTMPALTSQPADSKPADPKPADPKPAIEPTKPEPAAPVEAAEEPTPARRRSLTLPLIVGVGGLALVGTSIGFLVAAGSTYDDAKLEGNDVKQDDLWHSANNQRYVAEVTGVAGVAAIGVAVFLFVRSGGEENPRVQASVGHDHAGLFVNGSF